MQLNNVGMVSELLSRALLSTWGITLTPQHQPDPSPPARAPRTARTPRLLGRRLQGVLFLPVFRSTLVVFDFSLFPTELVMSPLGAGAGLAEHEAASSPGEGATAAAPVHPLVRALALAVVVLHGKPRTAGETGWHRPAPRLCDRPWGIHLMGTTLQGAGTSSL